MINNWNHIFQDSMSNGRKFVWDEKTVHVSARWFARSVCTSIGRCFAGPPGTGSFYYLVQ
jgi:hypothetical protein